jgi:hypothetical protein
LQIKALPEYEIEYLPDETYRITAPARFAAMLGVQDASVVHAVLPISPFLFDDQQAIVRMALDAKRFACWSNCGSWQDVDRPGVRPPRRAPDRRPRADRHAE